jgi:hypothetical protein
MKIKHGKTSLEKRVQLARMICEMKDHTEVVAVAVYPQCTPSVEWRRNQGRALLFRGQTDHSLRLGTNYLPVNAVLEANALIVEQYHLDEQDVERAAPHVEASEEPVPYETFTETVYDLRFQLPESDEEFFTRISSLYSAFKIGMAPMRDAEEALGLIKAIYGRLYAARHISLDNAKVLECLDDLDALYRAEHDDANGERTHEECLRALCWVEERLIAKYIGATEPAAEE